jgi:DNA polymerase-1
VVSDQSLGEVLWVPAAQFDAVSTELAEVLCGKPAVAAHDAKPILRSLLGLGQDITSLRLDTKLAAYLLDPADANYELPALLLKHAANSRFRSNQRVWH